jgi:hypothetical protein
MRQESSNVASGKALHQLLCLTPVRNEAWIADRYAAANATWADQLLVADQGSTDGTSELLARHSKVRLIANESPEYDERHRQLLLIAAARRIAGSRLMLALDADEALSANARDSSEWALLTNAEPGTVLRFKWVNVLPGFKRAWIPQDHRVFGFVDDGSDHRPDRIHSTRVPQPIGAPVIDFHDIVVLHFQYVAWERMLSKHRWYQAWETLERPDRGALDVFRQYHHMLGSWNDAEIVALDPQWLEGYQRQGIDYESLQAEDVTWWDAEILRWLKQHGVERFRQTAIWDRDWREVARLTGVPDQSLEDPRSLIEVAVHKYLAATQHRRTSIDVRLAERCLRISGW